jgi:hypothetical protein
MFNNKLKILKARLKTNKNSCEAYYSLYDSSLFGSAPPNFFVIPGEPGSGKSRAIQEYLRQYASGERTVPDGGVIVFLTRLAEIPTYVQGAKLAKDQFAVLVSGSPVDAAKTYGGLLKVDAAPILFTTAQMLRSRCGHTFASAADFFYNGKPRKLRLWDEEFVPADTLTINKDRLSRARVELRPLDATLAALLDSVESECGAANPGSELKLPSVLIPAAKTALSSLPLDQGTSETLRNLCSLSDRAYRIEQAGYKNVSLVGVRRQLPSDLAPLFVFDASARVSATYTLMEKAGLPMERLPVVPLSYENASFFALRKGASRSTMKDGARRSEIVQQVADTIAHRAAEDWLIVYPQDSTFDLPVEIRSACPSAKSIEFIYWGDHRAKNEYRHIENVICVGLNRYSPAGYEASRQSALGDASTREEDLQALEEGELASSLLQATARSAMRIHADGKCGKACIYIVDSHPRLQTMLSTTFPDCTIEPWPPHTRKLSGRLAEIAEHLMTLPTDLLMRGVTKKSVYTALGIDRTNFARYLRDPALKRFFNEHRIDVQRLTLRRSAASEGPRCVPAIEVELAKAA